MFSLRGVGEELVCIGSNEKVDLYISVLLIEELYNELKNIDYLIELIRKAPMTKWKRRLCFTKKGNGRIEVTA